MVNGGNNNAGASTSVSSEGASSSAAGSDEEPLLYVNARQYKRILKRRAARAKLHELGKIPKERPVSQACTNKNYCKPSMDKAKQMSHQLPLSDKPSLSRS